VQEVILLKPGEIFLKGQNRKLFESALLRNLKHKVSKFGEFEVKNVESVISIKTQHSDLDSLIPQISKVFGISSYCKALLVSKDLQTIKESAVKILSELSEFSTFKIEAKRASKDFPLTSFQICSEVGAYVVKMLNFKVDVNNPDVVLKVEIRIDGAYLATSHERGAGGLPSGTSGGGAVLISGGIDSPVAAYMMAKRGMLLSAIHFATPPYTSARSEIKVRKILEKLSEFSGDISFFKPEFTKIQEAIKKSCHNELFTIISRRVMIKTAEKIATSNNCSCLITGESLGQVASQTMEAIECTSAVASIPIFRPLIGSDKEEIIKIAKKIDTFKISIEPFEDCCSIFSPTHPKLKPKIETVKKEEQKIENLENLIKETIENLHEDRIKN
jgi:thiamine biosynthesis protein ThiI